MNAGATETKNVVVKHVGGKKAPLQLAITPGITAGDVLRDLGLSNQGFVLSVNDATDTLGNEEPIWGRVADGSVLHVASEMTAGEVA